MGKLIYKLISWVLIGALVIQPTLLHAQSITVEGPDNGPRPRVDESYNGTPVLNINTPNAAGVSHDIYTEFTAEDLILNNSATNVDTQIGGWIEGNPNLAPGQAARLWIGEVIGGNQTQLNGILEVAGRSMDVVLANEFGITCNGCGFVNTGRTTLTTGKPIFGANGSLAGFDVKQGTVTIGSRGLNPESRLSLADTSRVDVIARAAAVYGTMRADQLNIVAGANRVNYDWSYNPETGEVTGITEQTGTGAAPALAIDVAALGGMYANAIQMVATENGVGVRLDGEMASSSNIAIRSDGRLTLGASSGGHTPLIKARKKIQVRNQGPIVLEGSITSEDGDLIDIRTSSGALTFNGQADGGAITLESAGMANISGAIRASGDLKIASTADAVILGATSEVSGSAITVKGNTSVLLDGKMASEGLISVVAGTNVSVGSAGEIAADSVSLAGAAVANSGRVSANNDLAIAAGSGGVDNVGSLSGGDVAIAASTYASNLGKISATQTARIIAGTALETAASSEIFANELFFEADRASLNGVLKADTRLNGKTNAGDLTLYGNVIGQATVLTSANNFINEGAVVGIASNTLFAAGTLRNEATSEVSGGNLVLTGNAITNDGNIVGTGDVVIAAGAGGVSNSHVIVGRNTELDSAAAIQNNGSITGTETASLSAASLLHLHAGSTVYGEDVAINGAAVVTDGIVSADQNLTIDAGLEGLRNSGTLRGQNMTIVSASDISNTGIAAAGSSLTLQAAGTVTNAATLLSGDDLAIYADQILNSGGVIWANDSITLAKNDALDRSALVQNTNGRIEAFQGDLTIRADEVANLGTAPTISASEIIKWLEQGSSGPVDPVAELSKLIDPAFLDANGNILPDYADEYAALWADVVNGAGTLSAGAKVILKASVLKPSGTAIKDDFAGLWADMYAKANADGTPDPAELVTSMVDPDVFDTDGNILPEYAVAYAELWVTLASGGTTVSDAVKEILKPTSLTTETVTDPTTGLESEVTTNALTSDNTAVWAAMTAGAGAAYDIVKILYQDRFNDDGTLAEMVAGGKVDIQADTVRNVFGNISAGDDLFITANTVTNQAIGASQVLLEVHKKPGCFTCHEGEVDFYDTFGGRIEAVGNVNINGNLTNITLNSSELSLQDVVSALNTFIEERQNAGDRDLSGVPAIASNNLEFHDHRSNDETAPVSGNGADIRVVTANDTGSQTTVDTGSGTPTVLPLEPGQFASTVQTVNAVNPSITATASVDALLAAGLNTIAETNPEFTDYANFITSRYILEVDRDEYLDEIMLNTNETIHAALSRGEVIGGPGDLAWLDQPISVPSRDGAGTTTVHLSQSPFQLASSGALISGENVTISGSDITNSGTIVASLNANITVNNLTDQGGRLAADAGELALTALGSIKLDRTRIDAQTLDVIAGQDFTGKGVSIDVETDASIFAIAGVTLTSATHQFEGKRGNATFEATQQTLSSLEVGGNLSIISSADIVLAGLEADIGGNTTLSASRDLLMTAVQSSAKVSSGDHKNGTNLESSISHVTNLTTGGDFTALAGGQAVLVGTQIDAGGKAKLSATGDVILAAAQDIYSFSQRKSKKGFLSSKSSSHSITKVTNKGVRIAGGGDVEVLSDLGDLVTAGTAFASGNGDISLSATEGNIYAGTYTDIFQEEVKKSRSFLFGLISASSQLNTIDRYNTGTAALAALDLSLVSGADTTLVGANLSAGQNLNINTGGDFSVQAAIDSQRKEFFSSDMGLVTMTTITESSFVETAVFTKLLAGQGINLDIGGQTLLSVYSQAGVDAPSLSDLYPEELLALEGLQLLQEELANEYFYEETVQLSPAFKALVSIAIGAFVAPAIIGALFPTLAGAASGTFLSALGSGLEAFTSTFIVESLDAAIGGDFDIGDILKDAVFSGVSAGLTAGINLETFVGKLPKDSALNDALISGFGGLSPKLTMKGILDGAIDGAISSGLSSAVYGTDFLEGFSSSMVNTLVNLTLADVQFEIGELGVVRDANGNIVPGDNNWEGSLPHAILHGLAGCAAGAVQNGGQGCAAGAAGGIAQSMFAGVISGKEPAPSDYDDPNSFLEAHAAWKANSSRQVQIIGAIAGYLLSGGEAGNVSSASQIAVSGLENNYLNHTQLEEAKRLLAELDELCGGVKYALCAAGFDGPRAEAIREELNKLQVASAKNTVEMLQSCGSGDKTACGAHLTAAKAFNEWRYDGFFNNSNLFDVNANEVAALDTVNPGNLDWGRNLDNLALDIYGDYVSGKIELSTANARIHNAVVNYDGTMNLLVGGSAVALGAIAIGVACVGTAGAACAVAAVGGSGAILGSSDELVDGANTLVLGEAIENPYEQLGESLGLSEEQADTVRAYIDTGAMVVELAAGGYGLVKGGKLLGTFGRAGQGGKLNINSSTIAPNRTLANADDLADIRTRHGLSGRDTVAAARTDVPGLQGQTFEGLSPALRREGGLQSLDDLYGANRPIKSPNPNPIASRHAEEDIFNGIAQQIDNSGLTATQLNGRTVNVHISNAGGVCNVCYQGLGNSTATPGVIRQFSERYPGLNVRITAEGGTVRPGVDSITVRGGQIID